MASTFWFILVLTMALVTTPSLSYYTSSHLKLAASTISAAPSFLPDSPLSSPPALSPDITPLLPSPGGSAPSPTGSSSIPTIPSSPSPPNPDDSAAAAPVGYAVSAHAPSPSQPMSSSISFLPNSLVNLGLLLFWTFWFVQLLAK
ncbi:classical arabinogalactan protein 26-like [Macadamia integrifolia]|uniref:classical arabinogalactan protein 26-like n=1 Tax=Macadamia integrifolia TaxID=60698 RepID=UPI001C4FB335|nr:classical arabinogalactan protein 26-like [Macadamia integrifolia]